MNPATIPRRSRISDYFSNTRLQQFLVVAYVWFCFVKLPATSIRDSVPQSWEAVLAFAAENRLQWGSEVVFTFGPLGFLASDYYWGYLLVPIVLWRLIFASVLTTVFLPFWHRTSRPGRYALLLALPFLTVPICSALGFDAIYLLGITLLGVACLPSERPSNLRLVLAATTLVLLSCIKFSFAIYCACAVLVIVISNLIARRFRANKMLLSTCVATFLVAWLGCGQRLAGFPGFLKSSLQLASGYSSAMALSPSQWDRVFGMLVLSCLVVLLLSCWIGSQDWKHKTDRAGLVALGIFLAWKEGFVRADVHVVVFFVHAFLMAALLPALLGVSAKVPENAHEKSVHSATTLQRLLRWLPRLALPVATSVLLLSLTPFATYRKSFGRAVQNGFVPRGADTCMALFVPTEYKRRLEEQLEIMRVRVHLPIIKSVVGSSRIGVLNVQQETAILNGLNYAPHPVFQSYSAYTPELQTLNTAFFHSEKAPEYVLWRPGTVDRRVPSLDDGEVLLRILSGYRPVLEENAFVLWKRMDQADKTCNLVRECEFDTTFDHWFAISNQPIWCRIELRPSAVGIVESLLWSDGVVRLELQFADGDNRDFRMVPGNARHGFLLSPVLLSNADVLRPTGKGLTPPRVVAARVKVGSARMFSRALRVTLLSVTGLPQLESPPGASERLIANHEN